MLNGIPTRKLTRPEHFRTAVQADTKALSDRFESVFQHDPSRQSLAHLLNKQQQFGALHSKVINYTASPAEYTQSAALKTEVEIARQHLVASPSARYNEQNGEVTVSWNRSELPDFLQGAGFKSIRYTITREVGRGEADLPAAQIAWSGPVTFSAVAEGDQGKSLMVHIRARADSERPFLEQSLQAERGVGANHMLMNGELKCYCSSPDRSNSANLTRLSQESQAMTGLILADLGMEWNLAD